MATAALLDNGNAAFSPLVAALSCGYLLAGGLSSFPSPLPCPRVWFFVLLASRRGGRREADCSTWTPPPERGEREGHKRGSKTRQRGQRLGA
ncbi:hypothetical protein E2562_036459 [Oryza meyeriana var. granulata]|uniref:Uncharacterized protein n=1 Tax=Oryza meyeriana var. granulata TaxID=110450 RepID=A0A6G1ET62_9ORYZ|nr:hypothetical protein E2562_036459 [Oryza meyeriana var. granulata]